MLGSCPECMILPLATRAAAAQGEPERAAADHHGAAAAELRRAERAAQVQGALAPVLPWLANAPSPGALRLHAPTIPSLLLKTV